MRHLKSTLAVLGAAVILVLAGNTIALAATGKGFLLGKSNTATKITVLKRTTSGTPLSIHSKSSSNAPLQVNGSGKVANLNADKLDGLDSSQLKTPVYVFTHSHTVASTSFTLTAAAPAGTYLVSYSAYMNGAENGDVDCYIEQDPATGSSLFVAESRFTAGAFTPGASGSGYVTKAASTNIRLHCTTANPFTTYGDEPVQLVLTRVDTAATSSIRVSPGSARVGR